jgi:hypothetical protein
MWGLATRPNPGSSPAPQPSERLGTGYFKTPPGNIVCFYSGGPADMPRAFLGCGIRCASATTGLTCRNTSGHGFFLSRERPRAF